MKKSRKGLVALLLVATMATSSVHAQTPTATSGITDAAIAVTDWAWHQAHKANKQIEAAAKWLYGLFD